MKEYYPKEFKDYLLGLERSANTIDSYMRSIEIFFNDYDEVNKENLIDFKRKQLEINKPNSAALRCFAMNVYCDFLKRPEVKVKSVPIHNRTHVENVITFDEYNYFLNCLKRDGIDKLYWIIRFMASTGCRASETVKMEKKCLVDGQFTMWTKGKIRKILIPKNLIEESKEYFETVNSKYLFPNRYGKQMLTEGIQHQLTKYGERYGIRSEVLHPHSFRHFFAVQFLKENGNLTLLSNLMGHESISTTAIYLSLSTEEQKRQLDETMKW